MEKFIFEIEFINLVIKKFVFSGLVFMILSLELISKNLFIILIIKFKGIFKIYIFCNFYIFEYFLLFMIILKEMVKKELIFIWILINSMY